MFAAAGWSFAFDVGPLHVSLRRAVNPAIAAAGAAVFSAWWLGPLWFEGLNRQAHDLILRRAGLVAVATSVIVVLATWSHGAFIAGGADSSGYLTETRLWLAGSLRVPPPELEAVRFEHGLQVLAPLGLKPAAGQSHLVPTYPPGFPLLLAAFELVGGSAAKFWVVPVAAGLLVWTVFVLGRRLAGPAVGLLSAAGTAASPTFLFQAVQPMSDVPASCAWLMATTLLTFPSVRAAGGAAAAASGGLPDPPEPVRHGAASGPGRGMVGAVVASRLRSRRGRLGTPGRGRAWIRVVAAGPVRRPQRDRLRRRDAPLQPGARVAEPVDLSEMAVQFPMDGFSSWPPAGRSSSDTPVRDRAALPAFDRSRWRGGS